MNYSKLITSLGVCFLIAYAGSLVTTPSLVPWYSSLNKPDFTPPNWIFGPVWTILYVLMAVALYLVWIKEGKRKKTITALSLFSVQLMLNLFWSVTFFGLQSPVRGLIIIVLLWLSLAITIIVFKPISKIASFLLIPYLIWVSFALIFNGAIVVLN